MAVDRQDLVEKQFGDEQAELKREVQQIFETRTQEEWVRLLTGKEVCCEPIYDLDQVPKHSQIEAREMVFRSAASTGNPVDHVRTPLPFPKEARKTGKAPGHGEHTAEILKALGYSENEIRELAHQNVI